MRVRLGVEIFLEEQQGLVRGARVGAVVHPASILPDLSHTADVLHGASAISLEALFGPQHGARGELQDNMIESDDYIDSDTGLEVFSLYGKTRWPTEPMMSEIDVLLFDLQDVGTRVYTFIYTMAYCMEACARFGKRCIVLDRPNPINGLGVEGNLLEPEYKSFVGRYPIPMRHGMTAGELALLFNQQFGIGCDLTVVPMRGWKRAMWFEECGLPWIQPSPNLPTVDSTVVYPGMVLVEGTPLSEGRGTTRPFELIGAPYIKAPAFAGYLNGLGLPGVHFRPVYFQPTFQKCAGLMCGGVQVHVLDRTSFEPYLAGISTIAAAKALYPGFFAWRQAPYEYEYNKLPIEILCGGRTLPELMDRGAKPPEIRASWQKDESLFIAQRKPFLLYE
jgi:uncharacterized protein YbbC (DUF1343 family)